jgi:hypothetical protein
MPNQESEMREKERVELPKRLRQAADSGRPVSAHCSLLNEAANALQDLGGGLGEEDRKRATHWKESRDRHAAHAAELVEQCVAAQDRVEELEKERDQWGSELRARFAQQLASTIDADLTAAHAKGTTPATASLQVAVAALEAALSQSEEPSRIEQALRDATSQLAECYRLSGADPDGDPDWMLAKDAVVEVKRMRAELDERASEDGREGRVAIERVLDADLGGPCMDCGRPCLGWAASTEHWQAVMGDWDAGVLCPHCFTVRSEGLGVPCRWDAQCGDEGREGEPGWLKRIENNLAAQASQPSGAPDQATPDSGEGV